MALTCNCPTPFPHLNALFFKPSVGPLLQSSGVSVMWRHLRPGLAREREKKNREWWLFRVKSNNLIGIRHDYSSSNASVWASHPPHSRDSPGSKPPLCFFPPPPIVQNRTAACKTRAGNMVVNASWWCVSRGWQSLRGSGHTLQMIILISQSENDPDQSLLAPVSAPPRLLSVWQLRSVRTNFYGDSESAQRTAAAAAAARLVTRYSNRITVLRIGVIFRLHCSGLISNGTVSRPIGREALLLLPPPNECQNQIINNLTSKISRQKNKKNTNFWSEKQTLKQPFASKLHLINWA